MSFIQVEFFVFLAVFLLLYYYLKGDNRLAWITIGSYFFYGWYSVPFCFLLMVSTVVNFALAQIMTTGYFANKRKIYAALALLFNIGLLAGFKYSSFFWNDLLTPLGGSVGFSLEQMNHQIPPVGISFFSFQALSYTIDVYRGKLIPTGSLLRFAAYISCFPQLVAGPIVRAKDLLPQLRKLPTPTSDDIYSGIGRFVRGFLKKACIADSLGILLVDRVYSSPSSETPEFVLLAIFAYSFQIYFDFSGYSDMAIGIGRILGLKFPENFNYPYISRSFSEFWQRWHISLSSWLRDYLYISLGGNRKGGMRTLTNLMITMLLGGLWHGAGFLFVLWGLIHGLFLVFQHLMMKFVPETVINRIPSFLKTLICFILVSLAWIPFRSPDLSTCREIFEILAKIDICSIYSKFAQSGWNVQLILIICLFSHFIAQNLKNIIYFDKWGPELKIPIYAALAFACIHFFPESNLLQPFIYFQF